DQPDLFFVGRQADPMTARLPLFQFRPADNMQDLARLQIANLEARPVARAVEVRVEVRSRTGPVDGQGLNNADDRADFPRDLVGGGVDHRKHVVLRRAGHHTFAVGADDEVVQSPPGRNRDLRDQLAGIALDNLDVGIVAPEPAGYVEFLTVRGNTDA